jgi:hypothetical protein
MRWLNPTPRDGIEHAGIRTRLCGGQQRGDARRRRLGLETDRRERGGMFPIGAPTFAVTSDRAVFGGAPGKHVRQKSLDVGIALVAQFLNSVRPASSWRLPGACSTVRRSSMPPITARTRERNRRGGYSLRLHGGAEIGPCWPETLYARDHRRRRYSRLTSRGDLSSRRLMNLECRR